MSNGVIEEILRIKLEGKGLEDAAVQGKAAAASIRSVDEAARRASSTTMALGGTLTGGVAAGSKASSAALGQLAFQLNDVATMAVMGANPLQILASQGGQIAQVVAQAGGAMDLFDQATEKAMEAVQDMNPVVAISAVALGVLGIAYLAVNGAIEREAELTAALGAINDSLEPSVQRLELALLAYAVAIKEVTKAQAENQRVAMATQAAVVESATARQAEIATLEASAEAWERQSTEIRRHYLILGPLVDLVAGWSTSAENARTRIDALNQATLTENQTLKEGRLVQQATNDAVEDARVKAERLAAAKRAQAEATRRAAEAARAEAEAFRALQKELARELEIAAMVREDMIAMADRMFTPQVDKAAEALGAFDKALGAINFQDKIDDTTAMALAVADLTLALSRGAISKDQYDAAMAMGTARSTPASGGKNTTMGAISGALSNPLGAIADSNPIAGMIISAIQAAASLPETLTAITDMLTAAVKNIMGGGELIAGFIGDILGEILPLAIKAVPVFIEGLIQGIPIIVQGIIRLLPELAVGLVQAIYLLMPRIAIAFVTMLLDPATWNGLVQAIVDAFKQIALFLTPGKQKGETHGDGLFKGGGWFDQAEQSLFHPVEKFATGTDFVTRTGLAVVHQGERIVSPQGGGSGRTSQMMGGGGGAININVTGGIIDPRTADTIIRELNRHLGTNGRRLTWASGS